MPSTKPTTKQASTSRGAADVWTEEERAAMRESARERKTAARRGSVDERAEGEREIRQKFAEMPESDRVMAERIHALVMESAPILVPRTYYGMPAYAKDGKVLCFFQPASKFKARYATFGFNDGASLDDGSMWATSWALTKLTKADEGRIAALVKKAVGS
jgi:uncharacterized protein YdhG (YjbR/CyaY superfamily)